MTIQAIIIATVAQPATGWSIGQLQTAASSCCIQLQPAAADNCKRQLQIAGAGNWCWCRNQMQAAATDNCNSPADDKFFLFLRVFFVIEVA